MTDAAPTRVRYFAAAKAAMGVSAEEVDSRSLPDLAALLADAAGRHPAAAAVLGRCSFLVDGRATTDRATPLPAGGLVDVLPPFAGG